jgi:hypothetical protein
MKQKSLKQKMKRELQQKEREYKQVMALGEMKLAQRPLMVEQQSKEFMNLFYQINDLQQYYNLLVQSNVNPDDYLNEDQKILLERAQFFNKLTESAYFPSWVPPPAGQEGGVNVLDEEQQAQMEMLQQQMAQNEGMGVEEQGFDPREHYEQVGMEPQFYYEEGQQMEEDQEEGMEEGEEEQMEEEHHEEPEMQNRVEVYQEDQEGLPNDDEEPQYEGEE